MSNFDPSTFLDATITEASTKRPPLPAGEDFVGTIGDVKSRSWTGKKDPTQSGIALDIPVEIDLTGRPEFGIPKVILNDSIMLDLTADGSIDMAPGRNGKLRRYREALGMNVAGQPFSPRAMQGRLIKVKISHRPYEGELYDEIGGVAKA